MARHNTRVTLPKRLHGCTDRRSGLDGRALLKYITRCPLHFAQRVDTALAYLRTHRPQYCVGHGSCAVHLSYIRPTRPHRPRSAPRGLPALPRGVSNNHTTTPGIPSNTRGVPKILTRPTFFAFDPTHNTRHLQKTMHAYFLTLRVSSRLLGRPRGVA